MSYECILTEKDGAVGVITLNRPDALNAFNNTLMNEVTDALEKFDADDTVGCIVLTGSEKAFAAGADIKEIADQSPMWTPCATTYVTAQLGRNDARAKTGDRGRCRLCAWRRL